VCPEKNDDAFLFIIHTSYLMTIKTQAMKSDDESFLKIVAYFKS